MNQHQRPSAMVIRDPHAGHHNIFTDGIDSPVNEWTSWDFALATATQAIIDGTTEYGNLRWEVEDDDANIEVEFEIDREREAIALIEQHKEYKPSPGEWLRPIIVHPYWDKESGTPQPFQPRSQWIKKIWEEARAEGSAGDAGDEGPVDLY